MIDVLLAAVLATYHPPTVVLAQVDWAWSPEGLHCGLLEKPTMVPMSEGMMGDPTFECAPIPFAPQDDGYGKCPAFYHSHEGDSRCFDNDDNPQVEHGPVLPVPHYEL